MKRIVLLSGGLDSACALFHQLGQYGDVDEIVPVWVNYGQINAVKENEAARKLAREAQLKLKMIDVGKAFYYSNSTILPTLAHRAHNVDTDELVGRNAFLMLLAVCNFYSIEDHAIIIVAAHKTPAPYADCTKQFYSRMNKAIYYMTNGRWEVEAPYINMTKFQLLKLGWSSGMTKEQIDMTVSCYEGTSCGKCPACKQRKEVIEKLFY